MSYKLPTTREEAEALDEHDILGHARELFDLPSGLIYLVGHSLGPATHNALDAADRAGRQDWRDGLVSSWNTVGWFDLSRTVGAQIARLIGAQREEVIVTDSVSLNLYKLAHAAIPLARAACLIVEADEFPTDQYMIEALAGDSGAAFERVPAGGGLTRLEETGGILVLSAVNYRTAELRDMAAMEERAMAAGGVIIWDLSHATGVIALDLAAAGVRFAAGCTYKYLNGGPGAPAFVFIRQDLITGLDIALPGWMGHARPFAFEPEYDPAPDIRRFASGTPPILSLAALSGALEVFEALDLGLVQDKARALGDMVLYHTGAMGIEASSPRDSTWRGGHVSVRHPGGYEIVQALKAENILADFRAPGTIRFGGSPLYLGFADIWDAMEALADILETRRWDNDRFRQREPVT